VATALRIADGQIVTGSFETAPPTNDFHVNGFHFSIVQSLVDFPIEAVLFRSGVCLWR